MDQQLFSDDSDTEGDEGLLEHMFFGDINLSQTSVRVLPPEIPK